MIGTEILNGQGLGNQLFAYVTARAIAKERGCEFGICNPEQLGNNVHSGRGMYFMDIDIGKTISQDLKKKYKVWNDSDDRLFLGTSTADLQNGIYVSGPDDSIHSVEDNTLLYGNLQDESYFGNYREDIKSWLKVKDEYDSYEYTRDDLCIINLRGGEYSGAPELFLRRKYYVDAMRNMRKIRPDMKFMIVTDDEESAAKLLPGIEAYHFDMGKDYVTLKNARYLILSNSSFAIFPSMTSDTVRFIIAPKYWARHNVSDGYWASEQNIYSFLNYQDRKGKLFTADECKEELKIYKSRSKTYKTLGQKKNGAALFMQKVHTRCIRASYWNGRILRSLQRRVWGIFKKS